MKTMKYRIDKETIWEDAEKIKVYNYSPDKNTYTIIFNYVTKVYREYKEGKTMWKEVEGTPLYFHDMNQTQKTFVAIITIAEKALYNSCYKQMDKDLDPISDDKILNNIN